MSEPQKGNERYLFLEGVFVGIYGNWLISFFEKLTFTKPFPLNFIQFFLYFFGVASLGAFFILSFSAKWKRPKPWKIGVSFGAHSILMFTSLFIEYMSSSLSQFMAIIFFLVVGFFYWALIAMLEIIRIKYV